MEDITTCRVINKNDDLLITILTEWLENSIKITICPSNSKSEPLVGEMKSTDVETFATNLTKSRFDYIESTRRILSGRDTDVVFVLKDSVLRWKRGAWNHGVIKVAAAPLAQLFPSMLDRLLERHEALDNMLTLAKAENEELKASQSRLEEKTEEMIKLKNDLEADLYRRFAAVLNFKKAKIRELDEELKRVSGTKGDDLFDAQTDDSEDSGSKEVDTLGKRRLDDKLEKKCEEDGTEDDGMKRKKLSKSSEEVNVGKASTSRSEGAETVSRESKRLGNKNSVKDDLNVPIKNESLMNFISEDSEDDLFS